MLEHNPPAEFLVIGEKKNPHAKTQSRLPPSSHIPLLWRTSRPMSPFSYVGQGRKEKTGNHRGQSMGQSTILAVRYFE
jgi:hypothetical protein